MLNSEFKPSLSFFTPMFFHRMSLVSLCFVVLSPMSFPMAFLTLFFLVSLCRHLLLWVFSLYKFWSMSLLHWYFHMVGGSWLPK